MTVAEGRGRKGRYEGPNMQFLVYCSRSLVFIRSEMGVSRRSEQKTDML